MDPRRLALIRSGTTKDRKSTGSGYLIGPRLVLTARHVVMQEDAETPWPEIQVRVGHPGEGEDAVRSAEVDEVWPHPDGLDVALLLLSSDVVVPGQTVRWGRPVGRAVLGYEGLGFPKASTQEGREVEYLRGELSPLSSGASGLYVLDQQIAPDPRSDGKKAWSGASGSAVFCEGRLVGVVIRDDQGYGNRRLRACPAHAFLQNGVFDEVLGKYADGTPELASIGVSVPAERPSTAWTPFDVELKQSLWQLIGGDDCSEHVRELAEQLDYSVPVGYKSTIRGLVDLVAVDRRALASLSSLLAVTLNGQAERDELTRLLTRARALGVGSLLALEEHGRLLALLRDIYSEHSALLPRAAREALRYAVLPEPLSRPGLAVDDLEDVVEALEEVSDSERVPSGTPPVPALLRVVEYLAAAVGPECAAELRSWSSGVADRTGIHPRALFERREDARQWGAQQALPTTRVVLTLNTDRGTTDRRYVCRTFLARQDGTHTPLQESTTAFETQEEVARYLREAVKFAADESDHDVPWVQVLVDPEGLDIAVDEWNPGAPNIFVPGRPVGAQYRLTLSCPEMSKWVPERDAAQRRRWERGSAESLVVDKSTATREKLQDLLETSYRDTSRVVLHGPRDERPGLLAVCLALGVPVVLWDREASDFEDAEKLRPLDPVGKLADLPERVRIFRGRASTDPQANSARPALVWEDGGTGPESSSLKLMDPRKGANFS
ncbi:trypsin-like peptidase domain-containing protein [Kitasatospora sp. NPDC056273]|uniref:VMAP-C domain-containing protein n=1 Tax=Kitasatospora sp. NPDC056273 TaxID=3345769 RepID=UPI0035DB2CF8